VDYYDPLIPYLELGQLHMKSKKISKEMIKKYDCVIIATDHTKVNYSFIQKNAKFVFDVKNIYSGKKYKNVVRF